MAWEHINISNPQLEMIKNWVHKKEFEELTRIKGSVEVTHNYIEEFFIDFMSSKYDAQFRKTHTEIIEQNAKYDKLYQKYNLLVFYINRARKNYGKDCKQHSKKTADYNLLHELDYILKNFPEDIDSVNDELIQRVIR